MSKRFWTSYGLRKLEMYIAKGSTERISVAYVCVHLYGGKSCVCSISHLKYKLWSGSSTSAIERPPSRKIRNREAVKAFEAAIS